MRRLIVIAALLYATDAAALYPLKEGYSKVWARGVTTIEGARAAADGLDATILRVYPTHPYVGGATLMYVRDSDVKELNLRVYRLGGDFSASVIDETMVFGDGTGNNWDATVTVHPRTGIPASIPASRLFSTNPAGAAALYLVQFIGPATDDWLQELEAAGMRIVRPPAYGYAADPWTNRAIVAGTSNAAARAAQSSNIQWLDYWHPFMRGICEQTLHPRQWYRYSIRLPEIWRDELLAELRTYARVVEDEYGWLNVDIVGSDWLRLYGHRLIVDLRQGYVPWLNATAWPHRARPGTVVTITPGSTEVQSVQFRGVTSPWVESRNGRLYAVVPQIPDGPADITVRLNDDVMQVLPHDALNGFSVGEPESPGTLAKGDLVFLSAYVLPWGVGESAISAFDDSGALLSILRSGSGYTAGIAVDSSGFVVSRRDTRVNAALERMRGPSTPTSASAFAVQDLVVDAAGNYFAYHYFNDALSKETPAGAVLATYPIRSHAFDLGADQCTLYYASNPGIGRYDVCTNTPLASFVEGIAVRELDLTPDGGLLVVSASKLNHYSPSGELLQVTSLAPRGIQTVAVSADAQFAYVVAEGRLHRYDLRTRAVAPVVALGYAPGTQDLVVYGGWTAARGFATYADAPSITAVDPDGTIRGSNFVSGMTVTVNGVAVPVQFIDANTLKIAPPAAKTQVAVVKPNGQRATWGTAHLGYDIPLLDPSAIVALIAALALVAYRRVGAA